MIIRDKWVNFGIDIISLIEMFKSKLKFLLKK